MNKYVIIAIYRILKLKHHPTSVLHPLVLSGAQQCDGGSLNHLFQIQAD